MSADKIERQAGSPVKQTKEAETANVMPVPCNTATPKEYSSMIIPRFLCKNQRKSKGTAYWHLTGSEWPLKDRILTGFNRV